MFIKKIILDYFNLIDRGQNLFDIARANFLIDENARLTRRNIEYEANNNLLRLRLLECEMRIDKLMLGE